MGKLKDIIIKLFACFSDKKPTENLIEKIEQSEEWISYIDMMVSQTMVSSDKGK